MATLTADLIEDIKERAIDTIFATTMDTAAATAGIGNHIPNRGDRIARFEDMASDGTLDILQGMGAPAYDHLVSEYVADMKAETEAQQRQQKPRGADIVAMMRGGA